ncbi:MAG: DUF5915 domain-containing protein, partial [Candidatus Gracilibacteria bacterium]|nr:DUF5915 domain-containing protein [Candidatus Gracilibacteria bacterium]
HEGVEGIERLREQTRNLPIDHIVSSDFLRARHTADILNTDFEFEVETLAGLREQSFGEHEGKSFEDDLKKHGSQAQAVFQVRKDPKKGESLKDFEKRVISTVEDLIAKHQGRNILLVGHGGVYLVLKKYFYGIKTWEDLFENHFRYVQNGELAIFETAVRRGGQAKNKLDRWIVSELSTLIRGMTEGLDEYDLMRGLDPLVRFIDSLTNWYIRRSRRRFWKGESDADKSEAYQTLYTVLVEVCKLLAPFAPFITEEMYRNLTGLKSVHLSDWPETEESRIDESLNREMEIARQIVTLGHAARAKANMKVRQPLGTIEIALSPDLIDRKDLEDQLEVIREELNIKEIRFLSSVEGKVRILVKPNAKLLGPKYGAAVQHIITEAKAGHYKELENGNYRVLDFELSLNEIEIAYEALEEGKGHLVVEAGQGIVVILDTEITPELRREGFARDIVRSIQDLRKQADLKVDDRIIIGLTTESEDVQTTIAEHQDYIRKETLANEITAEKRSTEWESVLDLGGQGCVVTVERGKMGYEL